MTVTIANQVAISDVDSNDVQTKYVAGTLAFDAAHSSGHGVSASQFTLDAATGTISYDKAAFDYLSGGETVAGQVHLQCVLRSGHPDQDHHPDHQR